MNLAEFFISLGFDVDEKKLDSFTDSLDGIKKNLNVIKNLAIGAGLTKFIDSVSKGVVALENFNKQTGLAIDQLQVWQTGGQLSDIVISADQVTDSIKGLQDNLTQISLGGGNVAPLQLLGISVAGKDAFDVLEELRGAIVGLDDATATNLIQQLGLSPSFINVLRLTNEQFDALGDKPFLNDEQRDVLVKVGTALTSAGISFGLLADRVALYVSPVLTQFVETLTTVFDGLSNLIDWLTQSETATGLLVGALIWMAGAVSPVILAIAGIIAVIDDLVTAFKGGESVVGKFFEGIDSFAKSAAKTIIELTEKFKEFFKVFTREGRVELIASASQGASDLFEGFKDSVFGSNETSNNTNSNVSFNNTYRIQSTESPEGIANNIVNTQQQQMNHAMADLNNGVAN